MEQKIEDNIQEVIGWSSLLFIIFIAIAFLWLLLMGPIDIFIPMKIMVFFGIFYIVLFDIATYYSFSGRFLSFLSVLVEIIGEVTLFFYVWPSFMEFITTSKTVDLTQYSLQFKFIPVIGILFAVSGIAWHMLFED